MRDNNKKEEEEEKPVYGSVAASSSAAARDPAPIFPFARSSGSTKQRGGGGGTKTSCIMLSVEGLMLQKKGAYHCNTRGGISGQEGLIDPGESAALFFVFFCSRRQNGARRAQRPGGGNLRSRYF